MKKIIIWILIFIVIVLFFLAGCKPVQSIEQTVKSSDTTEVTAPEEEKKAEATQTTKEETTETTAELPKNTPIFNIMITSEDGTSFEIQGVYFAQRKSTGYYWKMDDPYDKERLEKLYFYTKLTNITIPLAAIKSIQAVDPDINRYEYEICKIVLQNGDELEGKIGKEADNQYLDMKFGGNTVVNKLQGEYETQFHFNIISVIFTKDEKGIILADLTVSANNVIHLSEPWCRVAIPDDNWSLEPLSVINLNTGDYTLQIPLANVVKIEKIGDYIGSDEYGTVTLDTGEKMEGEFVDHLAIIGGKNTVNGITGDFYANFDEISSCSITFLK
jgi:hypothetical protein